jgi:hypothetical protein
MIAYATIVKLHRTERYGQINYQLSTNRACGFRSLRMFGETSMLLKDIFYRPHSIMFFILMATVPRLTGRLLEYAAAKISSIFIVAIDYSTTYTVVRG